MTTPKKRSPPKQAAVAKSRRRERKAPASPVETLRAPRLEDVPTATSVEAEPSSALESAPALTFAIPEAAFAERIEPPRPERPLPLSHRAIFFDVENTSRAQHIAGVIDHLQIDRHGHRTEFFAVGNWRVIGHDTARLLARHGAHLVHSAPSVGVRDWSDLRIAVAAGAWLAAARPGDLIEIVSDDRAFDAVGDAAASLGITFRRLSYRGLAGAPAEELPRVVGPRTVESRAASPDGRGQRYRGRHRGRRDGRPAPAHAAPAPIAVASERALPADQRIAEPHTAPHDEIVAVVRDLVHTNPGRSVSIDTVANALKARGFSRPPGSPRLITRLRRLKEIELSRSGMITLVESASSTEDAAPPPVAIASEPVETDEGPQPGNEKIEPAPSTKTPAPGRRRRRRGGRRRRGRPQPTAAP